MKASEKCIALIKKWEGYHTELPNGNAKAYPDPSHGWKKPTIGFGSTVNMDTGLPVRQGDVITRETAERWLRKEADQCAAVMAERYPFCNENQIAALVSLTYNIGRNGIGDGLHGLLVAREWKKAADKLLEYFHADGDVNVEEGLLNRRRAEREVFLTPVNSTPEVPNVDDAITWLELYRIEENGRITTGVAAYAGADCRVTWSGTDAKAFREFLSRFKNAAYAPLVAPASKPWPTVAREPQKPAEPPFLRITRTGRTNSRGLEVLDLVLSHANGGERWLCHSGAPGRQVFQKGGSENIPGSLYPCPQGEYSVEQIQWAGGKDNYAVSHGPGLGPVFVPFEPKFQTRRGSFGFHVDENADTSPGSAGCVVFDDMDELKRFVTALRKHDPKKFVVDWKL